jgi:CMP-N,N'-diacetyllegionaminic acid synthase
MFKGKKILCVIPARKNSKGIKNKNIKRINGKPLIFFPINASLKSKFVDRTIFSTDSKIYQKIAIKFGADSLNIRPKNLSKDTSPTFDVLKDILLKLKRDKIFYDIIVLLEPTSPFTTNKDIDNALKVIVDKKFTSLVSVTESSKFSIDFQFKKLKNNKIQALKRQNNHKRRQDVSKTHFLDGSIYISFVDDLLKNQGFISNKTYGYELPKWKSIEIDDEYDLMLSRMIYKLKR